MSEKNETSTHGLEIHHVLAYIQRRIDITIGTCNVALSEEDINQIRNKLLNLYNLGYKAGRATVAHDKPVEKLLNGVVVDTYDNSVKAAQSVNGYKQGVWRAAWRGGEYKGYNWRFKK
jgi:hypothetical protein